MLTRFTRALGHWTSWLFIITVLATMIEVVARYVFNSPTIWSHETTIILCAVAFAVGGAYVQSTDEHIRVTVIADKLSGGSRLALDVIGRVLGIVFLGGVIWGGYRDAWEALSTWQTTQTAFNSPMPAIIRPILLLMAMLMLILLVRDIVVRLRGSQS